jgi:hypothetical protein
MTSEGIENYKFPFLVATCNIANLDFKTRWEYANVGEAS